MDDVIKRCNMHVDNKLQINKKLSILWYKRGICNLYMKHEKLAEEDFTLAIRFNVEYRDAYYFRGLCQIHRNDFTRSAIEDFNRVGQPKDDDVIALGFYQHRAYISMYFEKYDEALLDLNRAIKIWENRINLNKSNKKEIQKLDILHAARAYTTRAYCTYSINKTNKKKFNLTKVHKDIRIAKNIAPLDFEVLWFSGLFNCKKKGGIKDIKNASNWIFRNLTNDYFSGGSSDIILLYSFMPINEITKEAISENYLWFSDPKNFNDPFDTELLRDLANEVAEEFPVVKEVWNTIRIRCLTAAINSDEAASNELFWSHYAQSHQGMMLEIEFSKKQMKQYNVGIGKVSYGDQIKIKAYHPTSAIETFCFTKTKAWEYENEHRLIALAADLVDGNKLPAECFKIKSITFGLKTPAAHKATVRRIFPECSYFEMTQLPEEKKTEPFKLHRVECV